MEKREVSGVRIALVYIGTVVGAGFATGQEILQFFVMFGLGGVAGILLSTVLFVFYGVLIMALGMVVGAVSHREVLQRIGGSVLCTGLDALIMTGLFGGLTAMLAGSGALSTQQLGLTPALGSAVMGVLTALTVLGGLRGVIRAISGVVPFLLVAVVMICVFALLDGGFGMVGEGGRTQFAPAGLLMGSWVWAAVLYGAYNILLSAAVLAPLGAAAADRRAVFVGGALGGTLLGAASLMIYLAISAGGVEVAGLEVPLLHLAEQISPVAGGVFALVLLAEIYTTAVGALYGFSARILGPEPVGGRQNTAPTLVIVGTVVAAFFASLLGFSNLVRYLYPLQGYGGVLFLLALLYAWWRRLDAVK